MRIAVLSDIHGNLPALEAVLDSSSRTTPSGSWATSLATAHSPTRSSPASPPRTRLGVRGNHDAAAIGELDTDSFNDDARVAVEWTAEHIKPETRTWLAALPRRAIDAAVHARPRQPARPDLGVRLHVGHRPGEHVSLRYRSTAWSATPTCRSSFASEVGRDGGASWPRPDERLELDERAAHRQSGQRRPATRRRSAGVRDDPRH